MDFRIAIGVSSFAAEDNKPREILEQAGVEIVPNPHNRRLTEEEIIAHLNGVDGLIAGLEPLNRKVLGSTKRLKAIARVGIGMDNIDMDAAGELGIRVSNTPDGPTEAVAEMCLTALLALARQLVSHNSDLHSGIWKKRIGSSLKGVKVLLVGYGRIGRRFGGFLRFFGAQIMVNDPAVAQDDLKHGELLVSLEQGLQKADVVSMHASGIETILRGREFEKMRPGMILLNSARGKLIDEDALILAIENGMVRAAWLDTFSEEPYAGPLLKYDNVLVTPHTCTYTRQCRLSMEEGAVRNLLRDLGIALDH